MKSRFILLPILSLSFSGKVLAQSVKSEKIKPQWLHKQPKPTNLTFVYETDYAVGKSLDDATKRDHFATGRNICVGAAAALYVYNLLDAFVTPGARRVVTLRSNGNTYAFAPTLLEGNAPGVGMVMSF